MQQHHVFRAFFCRRCTLKPSNSAFKRRNDAKGLYSGTYLLAGMVQPTTQNTKQR